MYIQRERYVHMGRLNFATRGIFRFVRAQGEEAEVTKMCVCVCVCVYVTRGAVPPETSKEGSSTALRRALCIFKPSPTERERPAVAR